MTRKIACVLALAATAVSAQPPARRATNVGALLAFPGFFNLRPVLVVGTLKTLDTGQIRVSTDAGSIPVVAKGTSAPDGRDEIRGEFIDVGRLKNDDPRVASLDLRGLFHVDPEGPWPKPGEALVIVSSSIVPAQTPSAPSIRAIVLDPDRYLDQKVTVTGQYEGRNLGGDLPDAPGRSRYDFVLRSAAGDAAIWITDTRPKGKDFDLGLDARIDTGKWLQVTGTVQQGRGLLWIQGEAGTLQATKPPPEPTEVDATIRIAPGPPPEVVFSVPADGETDVSPTTNVRIQFSRDLDPATLKGHVHVSYATPQAVRGEPAPAPIDFAANYVGGNREVVVTFPKGLERFRTVKIELDADIIGTDKQPLKPWTLTFQTGG